MKILWLTNFIPEDLAVALKLPCTVKEGWVTGCYRAIKAHPEKHVSVSFAAPGPVNTSEELFRKATFGSVEGYLFSEDTVNPEIYDPNLKNVMKAILKAAKPDVVHIFGTEFAHARSMAEATKEMSIPTMVGLQGICKEIADHYLDGLSESVCKKKTFRDIVRKDDLLKQQQKFYDRAVNERETLKKVGHVAGRTRFDEKYTIEVNPHAKYHVLNETLRPQYYKGTWDPKNAKPHSIFLSQGNYPVKGLHYVLEAMPKLMKYFPDITVDIAGDDITRYGTLKEKIKISGYGKYLHDLTKDAPIRFLGKLTAEEMKEAYLTHSLFLCPSTVENSPNSLGEAMILGVPCVAAQVGGIPSVFEDGFDGIMYGAGNVEGLVKAVTRMWTEGKELKYSDHAKEHARETHNPEANLNRLLEIYGDIR